MRPELEVIEGEFRSAQARLHALADAVPAEAWSQRFEPARWSIAECVAHLNLTSAAYVPVVRDALTRARRAGGVGPRRYRRDPVGWLLWKAMGPPVRFRVKTPPAFVPSADQPRDVLVAEFDRLQAEQIGWVREADGLPLMAVKMASPFDSRAKYNLYACLSILPRHQHRHLWQAEQVRSV